MVGMPGAAVSNMNPPTVALLAPASWLIGLAVLVRDPVTRWLGRGRVWLAVVAANGVVMTVFLWHLTALFLGYGIWLGLCGSLPAAGSALWWQTRPAWLAGLAVICLLLVAAFRRAERPGAAAGLARSGSCHAASRPARLSRPSVPPPAAWGCWVCPRPVRSSRAAQSPSSSCR